MLETQSAVPRNSVLEESSDQTERACTSLVQSEIDLAMSWLHLARVEVHGGDTTHARELIEKAICAHKTISMALATFTLQLQTKRELQGEARKLFESIRQTEFQFKLL